MRFIKHPFTLTFAIIIVSVIVIVIIPSSLLSPKQKHLYSVLMARIATTSNNLKTLKQVITTSHKPKKRASFLYRNKNFVKYFDLCYYVFDSLFVCCSVLLFSIVICCCTFSSNLSSLGGWQCVDCRRINCTETKQQTAFVNFSTNENGTNGTPYVHHSIRAEGGI